MTIGAFRVNTLSAAVSAAVTPITSGTILYTVSGGTSYRIHNYSDPATESGSSFLVVSSDIASLDYLAVGGGGAGGGATTTAGGGGGGGGGYISTGNRSLNAGTYSQNIGTGGAAASAANGGSGSLTQFGGLVSASGGAGGTVNSAATNGGGSGTNSATSYTSTIGTYAFKGGNSFGGTSSPRAGGGGAGWAAAGANAASTVGGNGGTGSTTASLDGFAYNLAPGGGGGASTPGNGGGTTSFGGAGFIEGLGGGAVNSFGWSNSVNFGGGGGGGHNASTTAQQGGNGNSGFLSLRYPTSATGFIYYVAHNAVSTQTVTIPSGIQAGDVAFYFNSARNITSTIPTESAPSGWTSMFNTSVGTSIGIRTVGYYKILSGNEGGTTLTGMTTTLNQTNIVVIYRKQGASISSVSLSSVNSQSTDSAPTNQTLTMSTPNKPFIGFALYASNTEGVAAYYGGTSTVKSYRDIYPNNVTNTLLKVFECGTSDISLSNSTITMPDIGTQSLVSFTASIT